MRRVRTGIVLFSLIIATAAFAAGKAEAGSNLLNQDFASIERAARGTRVAFYMWGGSAAINSWIDGYVATKLRERHDITLERVPMDAGVFVNKLLTEKQAGRRRGTIDLLWINGENFKTARQADLLFGPFAAKLPGFRYVDPESAEFDFGFPVEGFEAPYGRAQFVFEYDSAKTASPPDTLEALRRWVKANPGRFTYPQPPDFTGSAFVRQVFYAVAGGHERYMKGFDRDAFERLAQPLWDYLNEIEPDLWQQGRAYPKSVDTLDLLFEKGEVDLNMTYHQAHAQNKIINGQYPASVRSFVMRDGSIYNTHFTAIPFNAPNKAGAMVTADFLLSPEAQYSKSQPRNWGDFTALDPSLLDIDSRDMFLSLDLGDATVDLETLARYGVPEIPSDYLEALEQGWEDNVLRK